ncbi:C40 family peptidase [Nocardia brasiliensis]|uniref:Putative hydrolase,putative peptidase domain protein n=1 Tax=Nocardia brasiliensis (strain ATCC 700358 / HUJEG-1) TaxID=1133849 RepID=K0ETQ3_NOCB7|nr:C40 family peptidase [Nocardia brasiliensis]AFT99050.1 putative hydrolase,putative peptidase domain protein [Nocardia brasiliensis ATCC 700358]OCF87217.1 hydrolase [Nocardia brasiliensis]
MIDIEALAKPIIELLSSFGSGVLSSGGPSDALRSTSSVVDQIHQMGRDSINGMNTAWDGQAADAATAKALRVQTSAATISDRGNDMATVVNQAAAQVETGQKELTGIVESFVNTAVSAGPALATPAGMTMIVGSAIDHLGQALNVVGRVRSELDTQTASMTELTPPPSTPSLAGTATSAASAQQFVSTASSALSGAGSMASGLMSSAMSTIPASMPSTTANTQNAPSTTTKPNTGSSGLSADGKGVKITLPDGSVVEAPNEKAATAVRSAISAVGTPYVWGGNTPGAGLDCSGLTKFAYGEAGVDIPRLAADQATGSSVSPGDLMPGDLAIWDGHVAMVIGNGQFVEAGDPVQISSIRTENSGMGFHGFYRPTS